MSARGYVSTAPRLRDFDGSTWMLAYSRGRSFARTVVGGEQMAARDPWNFFKARREALMRCLRLANEVVS